MASQENRKRERVISLDMDLIKYQDALVQIISRGKSRKPGYACFANVHMVIEAHQDKAFAEQVNNATLVLSDGMPLVKFLKSFYGLQQDRVAGMDVMPDLIKMTDTNQAKLFFFGTTQEILDKVKLRIVQQSPNANIVGMLSPPFDRSLDDQSYIDTINNSGAELVFVALGCPKQEKWMAKNSPRINAMLLGVGGAFPVYAGISKRAPAFLRNLGLEWAFRLMQEPRRLFNRYLKTNTLFLFLVLKIKLKNLLKK